MRERNPTNGSWWMVQIQPTNKARLIIRAIPPTGVGGWFRSSLLINNTKRLVLRGLSFGERAVPQLDPTSLDFTDAYHTAH
jgi:hypothetical protein